jgi:membrane-associated phospholipid phosphatase
MRSALRTAAAADQRLFARLVRRRSPVADRVLLALSNVASRGLLWLGTAALLAASGNPRARRAAKRGILALGASSAVVNGPLKYGWRRRRPRIQARIPPRGLIRTPTSSSFPSGHASSAFAFATATALEYPPAAVPVGALAVGVAYSRVHTGVHYPGDVLAGAALGTGAAIAAGPLLRAVDRSVQGPGCLAASHPGCPSSS